MQTNHCRGRQHSNFTRRAWPHFERLEERTVMSSFAGEIGQPGEEGLFASTTSDPTAETFTVSSVAQAEGNSGSAIFDFTVTRTGDLMAERTLNWSTLDVTATAASGDYEAASGTITFAPGESMQTIAVVVNGDTLREVDETFRVRVFDPTSGGLLAFGRGTIIDDDTPPTKFYTADWNGIAYRYSAAGESLRTSTLYIWPQGIAADAAGTKTWVVYQNGGVVSYDAKTGAQLGSWVPLSQTRTPNYHGITTNGADIWIVEATQGTVYKYANTADIMASGWTTRINPSSSFRLNRSNSNPTDLVTDGQNIWVVDNGSKADKIFMYTLSGSLAGSWTINGGGGSPTGITIDPTNVNDIWIVDNATDRVYQFGAAASRTSGSQSPASSFALAAGNTNPQGIADPPPAAATRSASEGLASDTLFDTALLSITNDLAELLGPGKRRK